MITLTASRMVKPSLRPKEPQPLGTQYTKHFVDSNLRTALYGESGRMIPSSKPFDITSSIHAM